MLVKKTNNLFLEKMGDIFLKVMNFFSHHKFKLNEVLSTLALTSASLAYKIKRCLGLP